MKKELYVTIKNTYQFYGMAPFKIGEIVKIIKTQDKKRGVYDITVTLPLLGIIGYVEVMQNKAVKGTIGASKIYNKIENFAYAQVMFITEFFVIAKFLKPEDVIETPYLRAYRKRKRC